MPERLLKAGWWVHLPRLPETKGRVLRVARDGQWADIRWYGQGTQVGTIWTKRHWQLAVLHVDIPAGDSV